MPSVCAAGDVNGDEPEPELGDVLLCTSLPGVNFTLDAPGPLEGLARVLDAGSG